MIISLLRLILKGWLLCTICLPARADAADILVLGDSLSASYNIPVESGWVYLLKEKLAHSPYANWSVTNASISGETTAGALARVPRLLGKRNYQVVIVELGANDGLRGLPPPYIEATFSRLLEKLLQSTDNVLLIEIQLPTNYGSEYRKAFSAVYQHLAKRDNVALGKFLLHDVYSDPALLQKDRLHPTAAAQAKILKTVWHDLEPLLKQSLSK